MIADIQHAFVVRYLMKEQGMSLEEATRVWMNSKTRAYLDANNLYWLAESRCYWELMMELTNDPRWLNEPFDM